jgi:uncharacterized protein
MKKVIGLVVACGALVAQSAFAVSAIRISQVYGGGGSTSMTATYNQDYVEIYNSSSFAVNISGWTIEYGSATGNWGSSASNIFTFPNPTNIPACSYILVANGTPSTGGAPLPITPDFTGTLTISATDGKVALFNAVNTNLACGSELPGTLVDKVAFGSGNCPEGTATAVLANNKGAVRNTGGAADTDNNSVDFTVTTAPVPRNSASGLNPGCVVIGVEPSTWSSVKTLFH